MANISTEFELYDFSFCTYGPTWVRQMDGTVRLPEGRPYNNDYLVEYGMSNVKTAAVETLINFSDILFG